MTSIATWKTGIKFESKIDTFTVNMDGKKPIGEETAPTPKDLLLTAIAGCTGMDVVALLKKYKQIPESFVVEVNGEATQGTHPVVFKKIEIKFYLKGSIVKDQAIEAVNLSQTKYCGVSAMVSKAVPISYIIELNGETIGSGEANFA